MRYCGSISNPVARVRGYVARVRKLVANSGSLSERERERERERGRALERPITKGVRKSKGVRVAVCSIDVT